MDLLTTLRSQIAALPDTTDLWIAYSGGCDSHVLLHAIYQLKSILQQQNRLLNVAALHVNHGLQQCADQWQQHCEQQCRLLDIPLQVFHVNAHPHTSESPEAAARKARYQAFESFLPAGDVLLLAHHQDDQAETLLLQLLRGAGPRGLSAMPNCRPFAKGSLLRPFLAHKRDELRDYARQQNLQWVEDPSNQNTRFNRNLIRHEIMPLLQNRWPSIVQTLTRVADYQAQAARCCRDLARLDWQQTAMKDSLCLSLSAVKQLTQVRQKNLIRYWIEEICERDAVDSRHLQRIIHELMTAAIDSQPNVRWSNTIVCRYRDAMYAIAASTLAPKIHHKQAIGLNTDSVIWTLKHSNVCVVANQKLQSRCVNGLGLKQSLIINNTLRVRFRHGGERCRPAGRKHHHSLKKLFQQWGVPPWLRGQIPLIYIGGELAQVVGYCFCEPFIAQADEQGIVIEHY